MSNDKNCPTCGMQLTDAQLKRLKMVGTDVDRIDLMFQIEELRRSLWMMSQRVASVEESSKSAHGRIDDSGTVRVGG